MSPRRRAFFLTAASFLLLAAWELFHRERHPYNDLSHGSYTDHFSHMNAARLFSRMGRDLWTVPEKDRFRPLTADEREQLPADVSACKGRNCELHLVDGWPRDKPLASSWSWNPRPYPPGDLLIVAPVAALYHYTSLSFAWANRLLILTFLVLAHLGLFVLLEMTFAGEVSWLITFFFGFELLHWTLEGFYDGAAVVPLLFAARALGRRRPLQVAVWFCVATFIHFRALFFVPWLGAAVLMAVRERSWQGWRGRDYAAGIVGLCLGAASFYTLLLVWPWLGGLQNLNPLHKSRAALANFGLLVVGVTALLAWARSWLDVVMALWIGVLVIQLRQTLPWHALMLFPWAAAPAAGPRPAAIFNARLVFVLVASELVFFGHPLPVWLQQLLA